MKNDRYQRVCYWEAIGDDERTIVLLPTLHPSGPTAALLRCIPGIAYYEERQLFNLLLLAHARTRLVLVTSTALDPAVLEYYYDLLPCRAGVKPSYADFAARLHLLPLHDADMERSLGEKICARPDVVERIRELGGPRAHLVCVHSTEFEEMLAKRLELPLLVVDHRIAAKYGTKSGSRSAFAACNIAHPQGTALCDGVDALVRAILELWRDRARAHRPLRRMVVKLNDGFGGEGNAMLDLTSLHALYLEQQQQKQQAEEVEQQEREQEALLRRQLARMQFVNASECWERFSDKFSAQGVIAEEFLESDAQVFSPSVQGVIDRDGSVSLISTHEQILDGHVFLGCEFPARAAYRTAIQQYTLQLGRFLAEQGVIDYYGVDYLVRQRADESGDVKWDVQAIEVNLRKGGTTHPMMALKFLCDGQYDLQSGNYLVHGVAKHYVANDNILAARYRGLEPRTLHAALRARTDLQWNAHACRGVVLHMLGALRHLGKIGVTCVADSAEDARHQYAAFVSLLDALAAAADTTTTTASAAAATATGTAAEVFAPLSTHTADADATLTSIAV